MRPKLVAMTLAMLLPAGWISAHSGVTNMAVMERMESMKQQQEAVKQLGTMSKGAAPFDAAKADAAVRVVAAEAARTIGLFRAPETDPKMEALPVIWEQFDDFETKARALEAVATDLQGAMTTPEALAQGLARLGAACKACHLDYRK